MDKENAKKIIAEIDYRITRKMSSIASLNKDNLKLKNELSRIRASKKERLSKLQDNINSTKLTQQKKNKREGKKREAKSFDNQINNKKKQIERVTVRIADEREKISKLREKKQLIKRDLLNPH